LIVNLSLMREKLFGETFPAFAALKVILGMEGGTLTGEQGHFRSYLLILRDNYCKVCQEGC